MDKAIFEAIIAAERSLLDPDFTEIGQSGRLWTRDEILAALPTADQSDFAAAELTERQVRELAPDCYLLTYAVRIGDRRSLRSSIWRNRDGQLRLIFNQGTPLAGDVQ